MKKISISKHNVFDLIFQYSIIINNKNLGEQKMKKLLVMFLLVAMSISVHAYQTVPFMFNDLVPYGITPDEVNEILVASNFSAGTPSFFKIFKAVTNKLLTSVSGE